MKITWEQQLKKQDKDNHVAATNKKKQTKDNQSGFYLLLPRDCLCLVFLIVAVT
jgi:hypothetical protein